MFAVDATISFNVLRLHLHKLQLFGSTFSNPQILLYVLDSSGDPKVSKVTVDLLIDLID